MRRAGRRAVLTSQVILLLTVILISTGTARASRMQPRKHGTHRLDEDIVFSVQALPKADSGGEVEEASRSPVAAFFHGVYQSSLAMTILSVPFLVFIAKQALTGGQTTVLLILPFVAAATTISLTIAQGTSSVLVSDALNYSDWEPWPFWVVRYSLWHATFAGVYSFKRKVFPPKLQWLAVLNLVTSMVVIWSGFSQVSPAKRHVRWHAHWASALVLAATWAIETPSLWAQGQARAAYFLLMLGYVLTFLLAEYNMTPDTGIPLIGSRIGIPLQWAMFAFHLILIHVNYPRIRKEGFSSRFLGLNSKGEAAGDFSRDP